jgi:NADH dehydrogenase/NADH:ubiquinone oxidoreductase subunit G
MPKTVEAKINEILLRVPEGTTILEAARQVQIKIPVLCKHPRFTPGSFLRNMYR